MFKEITLDDAKGKEIQDHAVSVYGQMVIVFADETFTTLGIDTGFEQGDETIVQKTIELLNFGHNQLIALGIVTQKELDDKASTKAQEFTRQREREERMEYRRLKIKYQ
jgi:predicted Zn-dependent peptidase